MTTGGMHLSREALLDYWLRESSPGDTDAVEEHLMRCDACGEALDELVGLAGGVRAAVRAGEVWAVASPSFAQRAVQEGRRVREYRLAHNGSVNCTVAPDDEMLVTRLAAPLRGVRRLDVASETSLAPGQWLRAEDVPFDPEAGEVVWIAKLAQARGLPEQTIRVKLLAVEEGATRELGTYVFHHRPWPGSAGQDSAGPAPA